MASPPQESRAGFAAGQDGAEAGGSQNRGLLAFTTGGMRGIMKEGHGGINETTCNMLGTVLAQRYDTIVIGYDQRSNSERFAQIVAAIFVKNCKHVAVFKHCTTPYLAFESANFDIGLMITASHNPKEYNGFKVYADGSQIVGPLDKEIEREMWRLQTSDIMGSCAQERAGRGGGVLEQVATSWHARLSPIDYKRYLESFGIVRPGRARHRIRPVFSALHGVSGSFMAEACKHFGMEMDLSSVQNIPDGGFGGISHPNPEIASNYDVFARDGEDATVFMCDPDGDRFGLCVCRADSTGKRAKRVYNGDEIAMVLFFYIYKKYPRTRIRLANTHLCGGFFSAVSRKLGIPHSQTETGFKHVCRAVREFYKDAGDSGPIVLAYEDPLGFLAGPGTEKDGIKAAVVVYFALQEYDLDEIFNELLEFGTHSTHTVHVRAECPASALRSLLARLEHTAVGDRHVVHAGSFRAVLRISGTEPLIKIYTMSETLTKDELVEKAGRWIESNVYSVLGAAGG